MTADGSPPVRIDPAELELSEPGLTVVHIAEQERARLRAQAEDLGGASPLLHFVDSPEACVEITTAHPGSLPKFITGKSTLLSHLFRDEVGHRRARLAAERITTKHLELHAVRGIEAVHLAVGLAEWTVGGAAFSAPVLLRPLAIRRHHTDYELKLYGAFHANPQFVRALREQFGLQVDAHTLVALAYDGGVFNPQPVISWLRAATQDIAGFQVTPRIVVSTFADIGTTMSNDIRQLDHPVLNALAGHHEDRQSLREQRRTPPWTGPDDRAPASDALLLDADAEQESVLARIADGQSFLVSTLPGTGSTQTVINAVGMLVAEGKRVLVVSSRRSTLDSIRHRLSGVGLDGLAVSPTSVRSDLVRAISRNERAEAPKVSEIDDALVRLRAVLRDYRGALTGAHSVFDVSALEATRELTRLASLDPAPSTNARLTPGALASLATGRREAAKKLRQAARLGEFRFGPDDSPWYGVSFETAEKAHATHARAGKLHAQDVPALLENGYRLIGQTRLRPFTTIDELGEYLRLLQGIRDSLDRFLPAAFEQPLGEIILALGPRRHAPEMSGAQRRRLKNLARVYVRPGSHVPDMYEALLRVQRQSEEWQRVSEFGAVPEVPLGLADVYVAWQKVSTDLAELDAPLGRSGSQRLGALPAQQLVRTLGGLAAESDVFDNLVERTELRIELQRLGLEPLMSELAVRHVPESQVESELEFAWWQSVLEHLLRTDRALLGANTAVVDRLERDFRFVDEAHAQASAPLLAWQLATAWRIGIVDHPDDANAIKATLTRGIPTPTELFARAPELMRVLAPVWVCSPYDVPLLPDSETFDTVIMVDAAASNLAEAAPAIRRGRQLVMFGDAVIQRPTAFTVLPVAHPEWVPQLPFDTASAFERIADVLPVETLTRSYRAGGEDLAELVNDAYGGEISSMPWAGSYLGRGSLALDFVAGGTAPPDPVTGAIESPDAEVQRVVTLVLEHAVNRPRESLMVVTASRKHAVRVRAAVSHVFAGRADVADFVSRDAGEPFAVLTLEESVAESRDRVIFSVGYGVTRHGRLLSDYGDLSTLDGERLFTVAMTRARRSMVVVSSIAPKPGDEERVEYGAATLMALLNGVTDARRAARVQDVADPLTLALARELRRLGISVDVGYRGLLPLVAQYGGKAVVAESDPEAYGGSLRESLRLRPHVLRRLGWHYVRVHAFDLYSKPAEVAERIAGILGVNPGTPRADGDTQPITDVP